MAEGIVSEAQDAAPVREGVLKESHTVEEESGGVFIGATARHAASVHARHATKAGWFVDAIRQHGPRIMVAAVRKTFAERGGVDGTPS